MSGTLLNTGRDLRVILDEPSLAHSVNVTGGPLSYQYRITEILLHFGSISSLGSEHTIAGVSFPAEVSSFTVFQLHIPAHTRAHTHTHTHTHTHWPCVLMNEVIYVIIIMCDAFINILYNNKLLSHSKC